MKIVVNRCFGGFGLSEEAVTAYLERKNLPCFVEEECFCKSYYTIPLENRTEENPGYFSKTDIERNDPDLVAVVELLGDKASGDYAELEVVEIPDDVKWFIHNYDGRESIHEEHRSW